MSRLTESQIMGHWQVDGPIQISICCITYKQELYIEKAIDSFLMQKTSVPFEIIIGEDCGGDSTLSILSKYQVEYPNILRVLPSERNVGANANILSVVNSAKGRYIAFCEGDDYWIDESKIEKQFATLEKNVDVDLCFTSAKTIDSDGVINSFANYGEIEKNFSISDVARGGGGFMPSASLFFRKNIVTRIPEWFISAPIGDFYLQILGSINHGAIYLPHPSVVYRINATNSWSASRLYLTKNTISSTLNRLITCADGLSNCGLSVDDVSYIKAAHRTDAAVNYLRNGYFTEAKIEIAESWKTMKGIGRMQLFLYLTRFFPKLSLFILNTKS
ncbi:glycosyltransferase [Citrobacter sp. Cf039]|uniref:glycosyltransferase n=1 Tax=Citrobacter TaxID=544 RepID=UPI001C7040AE|nr:MULTISPECIES: glycosyltransferase [Citrobacter]EJB5573595.1 glycosyltransferase [Citrobacter freundii]MBW9589680.1 glycosyltransferase [Citrobacter freundii]MDM3266905.1 glycosyltransferase [Citrobacter sp. Cf039]MDM3344538.1 glycosyltransferase [Citrobacter sp. Cf115]MDS0959121.1 glycosyltransferase [Citrobacter freundii]